jgi:diacylglycerol kinase
MGLRHSTTKSFSYAFEGVKTALKREPNFRIHIAIAIIVLIAAYLLRFNFYEWILLFLIIFFVIVLELINTVHESIVNLISPEKHPEAKAAKDVSAAIVLFASFFAIVIGVILFGSKLFKIF